MIGASLEINTYNNVFYRVRCPLEITNRLSDANSKIRRQMGYSVAYPTGRECVEKHCCVRRG